MNPKRSFFPLNVVRLVVVGALCTVVAAPAYAYLDPNAGSILLQVLLGGVAGAAVAARLFWHRIRRRWTGSRVVEIEETKRK